MWIKALIFAQIERSKIRIDMEDSFIGYIEKSIHEHWDLDALTDYKGATLQYKDVARKIEKLHIIFQACEKGG